MYIGAIDVGGTKTMAGVVDERGRLLAKAQFPTLSADPQAHIAR